MLTKFREWIYRRLGCYRFSSEQADWLMAYLERENRNLRFQLRELKGGRHD